MFSYWIACSDELAGTERVKPGLHERCKERKRKRESFCVSHITVKTDLTETQGSCTFSSASVCVVFCFHSDISHGSSTEGETEKEENGNLPSPLPTSLSLCQPIFTVTKECYASACVP